MDNKLDITISKKATINAGNYSSIQPSVSITLKDVPSNVLNEKAKLLKKLTSALLFSEIFSLGNDADEINKIGLRRWLEVCDYSVIDEEVKTCMEKLEW